MKNFLGGVSLNYQKYYQGILPYIKKEKTQQSIAIILTFTASIFFLLFAISPTLSTISRLRKEVEDSKFVDQKLTEKVNNLSSLSQSYGEIQQDIPYVLDAVPQKPDAPTLVAQIQSIADTNSVTLINVATSQIDLSADQGATRSSGFSFELTGSSTYENIDAFLASLANMQRVISIDAITIERTSPDSSELQLNLKGSAYYKKQ